MTPCPLGYLAGWMAFEDIHADAGPLEFYPGSHLLPYVFSHHLGISAEDMQRDGYATYRARYEPLMQKLIRDHTLQPHYFEAKKGHLACQSAARRIAAARICGNHGGHWRGTTSREARLSSTTFPPSPRASSIFSPFRFLQLSVCACV